MLGYDSVLVSSVLGNTQLLDGGSMFGNAPKPLWERWVAPDSLGRIPLACRALLVELKGKRILCETGIGAYMAPDMALRFGVQEQEHKLLESLGALGLTDSDIDFVILSHLHFDHAGGLLAPYREGEDISLLFPKAQFVVGKKAWQRAQNPHARDRASFIPGLTDALEASGRLLLIEETDELPGISRSLLSFRLSDGHTPGHMHTIIHGKTKTMIFAGDLIPGKAWVHLPITMGYDRFPEKVIDEKEELYAKVVKEAWLVFYTHDTQVAASEISKDTKGKFIPQNELSTLVRYSLNS